LLFQENDPNHETENVNEKTGYHYMKHPNIRIQAHLDFLTNQHLPLVDLSLERLNILLSALGNPENNMPPVIHVAGTNGKGSLLAYLKAIFEQGGYRVHRLTSPYLVRFNEQITIAGEEISDDYLLELLDYLQPVIQKYPVTFFEAGTALAFLAFASRAADIVLLETGLGGRLDSTNVIQNPLLTAITPISMDHSEFLGDSIAKIATEKAGILKQGVPCVVGSQSEAALQAIRKRAAELDVALYEYGKDWHIIEKQDGFEYISHSRTKWFPLPNLAGRHQMYNAATAISCMENLPEFAITHEAIAQAITHTQWQARLQPVTQGKFFAMLPPYIELWLDGGHNPGAGEVLADWLQKQGKPVHLIAGMLNTKDAAAILRPLVPYITSLTAVPIPHKPQSYTAGELAIIAENLGIASQLAETVEEAIQNQVKSITVPSLILICGSLYLAGHVLWENG